MHHELHQVYQGTIMYRMNYGRFQWDDHLVRMSEEKKCEKIGNQVKIGFVERHAVEEDLGTLNVWVN